MKNTRSFLIGLYLAFLFTITSTQIGEARTRKWENFISEEGRFSILVTGKQYFDQEEYRSPVGKIQENIYTWKNRKVELSANYSDLPWLAVFFGGHKKILGRAKEVLIESEEATELSLRKIKLEDRHDGIEIDLTIPPRDPHPARIGKARFYLVKKRIYVLMATTPVTRPDREGVDRFIDSFQRLPKK